MSCPAFLDGKHKWNLTASECAWCGETYENYIKSQWGIPPNMPVPPTPATVMPQFPGLFPDPLYSVPVAPNSGITTKQIRDAALFGITSGTAIRAFDAVAQNNGWQIGQDSSLPPKCECGIVFVRDATVHSDWCPMYTKDVK